MTLYYRDERRDDSGAFTWNNRPPDVEKDIVCPGKLCNRCLNENKRN